jgi:hypothetical protein
MYIDAVCRNVLNIGRGGGLLPLQDRDLARISLTNGLMFQSHVVGQDVNRSAVFRANAGREDQNFTTLIALEHDKLGVELEALRIV